MAASAVAVPSLSDPLHLRESEKRLERREVDPLTLKRNTNTSCLHRKCQHHIIAGQLIAILILFISMNSNYLLQIQLTFIILQYKPSTDEVIHWTLDKYLRQTCFELLEQLPADVMIP